MKTKNYKFYLIVSLVFLFQAFVYSSTWHEAKNHQNHSHCSQCIHFSQLQSSIPPTSHLNTQLQFLVHTLSFPDKNKSLQLFKLQAQARAPPLLFS